MASIVRTAQHPAQVVKAAGDFLRRDPVGNNLVLTLLAERVANPEPGRYWIVEVDGAVAGVVFQSPRHFPALVTPMPADVVGAAVDAVVHERVELPGVSGDAATAALFAGRWAERTGVPAHPIQAMRLHEVDRVVPARPAGGALRPAAGTDRDLLVSWLAAFAAEAGDLLGDPAQVVQRRLPAGHLWLWDDDGPAAMAGVSDAVAGVVRVGPVYTPGSRRRCGYASALVAAMSSVVRSSGRRCILYTDLGNPTSNSIYRSIGYRAVDEVLRYRFGGSS